MALGLPGTRAGEPFFITGEPRREFYFKFLLTPCPSLGSGRSPKWTSVLFSSLYLIYVSSLAEQVNLPSNKLTFGSVNVGSLLDYPYPKGFNTPTFSVVYLEDELESVYKFHNTWQNNIRGDGGGLQFVPLGNICCSAFYFPLKKVSLSAFGINSPSLDKPVGGDVWPYVFPSDIQRSPANKGGSSISKTTVVYTRVVNIKKWNYVDKIGNVESKAISSESMMSIPKSSE